MFYNTDIITLYSQKESEFDSLAELATHVCHTSHALIMLKDDARQYLKSYLGTGTIPSRLVGMLCQTPLEAVIVENLSRDHRYEDFKADTEVRCFVSLPIFVGNEECMGVLLVFDHHPRTFSLEELRALELIRNQVNVLLKHKLKNINDQKTIQELEQVRTRKERLVENSDGIFWEADPLTFEFLYISPQVKEILGYNSEEWLDTPDFWQNIIHPDDKTYAVSYCHTETQALRDHAFAYRMRKKNGGYIWVEDRVKVYEKDGRPYLLTGLIVDISKEKDLSESLSEKVNLLESILANLPIPFFLFEKGGKMQMWNKTTLAYTGTSDDTISEHSLLDFFQGEEKTRALEAVALLQHRDSVEIEAKLTGSHGAETHFYLTAANITYQGKPCVLGVGIDMAAIKDAEDKLANSERRFQALMQEGSDMLAILDTMGRYTYISPNCDDILGVDSAGLIGKPVFDNVLKEDLPRLVQEVKTLSINKRVLLSPFRVIAGDGSLRWIETIGTNLLDDPIVRGFVANSRDITAKFNSRKQLEKSEAQYRAFFESQTNYLIRIDLTGRYVFTNQKFLEDFGWAHEGEIVGQASIDTVCDYDHEKVRQTVEKCLQSPGRVFKVEIDKPARNYSGIISTLWDFVCLLGEDGQPSEIQCSGINITDRIKAERRTQQTLERLELINKASNDAIWEYDAKKDLITWGPGFASQFGYDTATMPSTKAYLLSLIHPEDAGRISSALARFLEGTNSDNILKLEFLLKRADGSFAPVAATAIAQRNQNTNERVVGTISDISHLRQYEYTLKKLNSELEARVKELSLSNNELEQFAYIASHDLQEPLRMISSFLALIVKKYGHLIDEKGQEYFHFAIDGAQRMRGIILDLLEFSRVGRNMGERNLIDLSELVGNIKGLYTKKTEQIGGKLAIESLPTISGFQTPLMQIFQNLLDNAIKYAKTDMPLHIQIGAKEAADHWQFWVSDNGMGIPPEYHDKIFVLFQRLHDRQSFSGTGIGLAVVKKNVELLGGKIWVESDGVAGSTFHFTLPKE